MPSSTPKTIDTAFTGDSGSGGAIGLVPAPTSGDSSKYLKGDGTWGTVSVSTPGLLPFNYLTNPGFRHWARNTIDPTAAFITADGAYGSTCWYTLSSSALTQVAQITGTTARYGLKLTADSAGDRSGACQVLCKDLTHTLRGKTVIAQARVKRSTASKTVRIALVEWTGTADAPTKDIVNSWSNGTFTAGNFFTSTTVTVIGTGTSGSMAADTWTAVSVSGTVSASANNLYVLIWTEDTMAGSSTMSIECPGLYEGSTVQTWAEGPTNELTNPERYGIALTRAGFDFMHSVRSGTAYLEAIHASLPTTMRVAPTASNNVSGWTAGNPTGVTVGAYNEATSAYVTISGSLTFVVSLLTPYMVEIYVQASSSFNGSAGQFCGFRFGASVVVTLSAELGV